jgi:hypothetical protein
MNLFVAEDIIERSVLTMNAGRLPVLSGPGLVFELNLEAVQRAREAHRRMNESSKLDNDGRRSVASATQE